MTPEDLYGLGLLIFGGYLMMSLFLFVLLDQISHATWNRRAESAKQNCTVLEGEGHGPRTTEVDSAHPEASA